MNHYCSLLLLGLGAFSVDVSAQSAYCALYPANGVSLLATVPSGAPHYHCTAVCVVTYQNGQTANIPMGGDAPDGSHNLAVSTRPAAGATNVSTANAGCTPNG